MANLNITNILEKMTGKDKDYRYMATSDLLSELNKESFKADQDLEPNLTSTVLQQLEDASGDVSGLAIKCLAPLVKKVGADKVVEMTKKLCDKLINGKEQHRDAASIALKTIIAEVTTPSLAEKILVSLAPQLIKGVNTAKGAEIKCECLDILGNVLHRFGYLTTKDHEHMLTALLSQLGSNQGTVRKQSISCIASLAPSLSDDLLAKATSQVVQLLKNRSAKSEITLTNIQMIGSLSRSVGHHFGPHLAETVPLLISYCTSASENDEELREYSLQALESFMLGCRRDISPYCEGILNLALEYVSYDQEEDDDGESANEYTDDEDASWKVRRASVKCLSAIIISRPEMLSKMYLEACPKLIERFREREENVKMDIFNTFIELLRQTGNVTKGQGDIEESSPGWLLKQEVPKVVKSINRQLREKSIKTKVGAFSVLKELVVVLPDCLADHFGSLVPEIEKALNDKSSTSNLKIEALVFTRLVMASHSPSVFHPYIQALSAPILSAIGDTYYKVTAEALRVCGQLVRVLRPNLEASTVDFRPYIGPIYNAIQGRLANQDQDQEVKECAISCMSLVVSTFGDGLQRELPACLPMTMEKHDEGELTPNTIIEKHDDGDDSLYKDKIRNIVIICPQKYDKTKLLHSLVSSSLSVSSPVRAEESKEAVEERARVSSHLSFCYDEVQVNILDAPGRTDAISQATNVLSLADGAILFVDEEAMVHNGGLLKHAVSERIRPVLALNGLDSWLYKSYNDGEEAYQNLFEALKETNKLMKSYNDSLLVDLTFKPEKGTVAFCSMSHDWAFTLPSLLQIMAPILGIGNIDEALLKKIWGDHFFDSITNKWTKTSTGSPTCKRGFVHFCYEPIIKIIDCCRSNNKKRLLDLMKQISVTIKGNDLIGEDFFKVVMGTILPARKAYLDMVKMHLPSPLKAQSYRVENLYRGPLNDMFASALRKPDPSGPLLVYIAKTIPSQDNKFGVLARVFSGTIQIGMEVRIIGPNDLVPRKGFHLQKIEEIIAWKRSKHCSVKYEHAYPGDIILLFVHEEALPSNVTLTNVENTSAYPIRSMNVLEKDHPVQDAIFLSPDKRKMRQLSLPYCVYDALFMYQREGLYWLWQMYLDNLPGCILADDMGLGKTRQVCAFVRGMFHSKLIKKVIVVAPASVVAQWEPELSKVGIDKVKVYTTSKAHRNNLNTIWKEGGVLLTTYGVFRNNWEELEMPHGEDGEELWDYVIMDEGHRAKERTKQKAKEGSVKVSEALKNIKCAHKIIMTGTPLQNNLEEFFTLVDICNPTLLGEYDEYQEEFVGPVDRGKHRNSPIEAKKEASEALKKLKQTVAPFVLRRTKSLLKAIGSLTVEKFEYIVWLKLSGLQRDYYKELMHDEILREKGAPFAVTDVARDICRHPRLLMTKGAPKERKTKLESVKKRKFALRLKDKLLSTIDLNMYHDEDTSISSKLSFIVYIVPKMIREGHRILIFSQSPGMLLSIQNALESTMDKHAIIRMDGSTKRHQRNKMQKAFQKSPWDSPSRASPSRSSPSSSGSSGSGSSTVSTCEQNTNLSWSSRDTQPLVFLMTTRVGGVGLNLTQASRVIIADPAENPSEDNQAVDRAYRYGQQNDVVVYRLMACAVIEEHTYREQVVKVESSIAVLERPCMRQISQREGLVLKEPPKGYDQCETHSELYDIYGHTFDISPSDLNIEHESVVAISNHSLVFSKDDDEDELTAGYLECYEVMEQPNFIAQRPPTTQMRSTHMLIPISETVAARLHHDGQKALTQIKKALKRKAWIKVGGRYGDQSVSIIGDSVQDTEKAAKLIEAFKKKVSLESRHVIYIPAANAGLIIGTGAELLEKIKEETKTHIEINARKGFVGQKAVIIRGKYFDVLTARFVIADRLEKYRVLYTEDEDVANNVMKKARLRRARRGEGEQRTITPQQTKSVSDDPDDGSSL